MNMTPPEFIDLIRKVYVEVLALQMTVKWGKIVLTLITIFRQMKIRGDDQVLLKMKKEQRTF
jgi:hypothetical protein